jgi:DNA-binding LacI/PurR family transcriptional regulator
MSQGAVRQGRQPDRTSRVTIADIARRARVAKSSASYALNGRPGVAAATRQRVVDVATAMGWRPNVAARALSAARANAVGLVLAQPAETLGFNTFYLRFIAGLEEELSRHDLSLLLRVVPTLEAEISVYQQWLAEQRVDGVIVVDLRVRDPRVAAMERLGLPGVVVGMLEEGVTPAVWPDDEAAMTSAVEYLVSLGHRRLARVGLNPEFVYTRIRRAAFLRAVRKAGLAAGDWIDSRAHGEAATRALLTSVRRPTAIIYEDEATAVAALAVAREMGVSIPHDLSIIGWDDSLLCQLVNPALTALHRDIVAYGEVCARHLVRLLEGDRIGGAQATVTSLVVRGSTAPPRAPGLR